MKTKFKKKLYLRDLHKNSFSDQPPEICQFKKPCTHIIFVGIYDYRGMERAWRITAPNFISFRRPAKEPLERYFVQSDAVDKKHKTLITSL